MSDQTSSRTSRRLSAPFATTAAVLVLGGALGALAGWLWWRWWGPPTSGIVYDTASGPRWYDFSTDHGITHVFDSTAQFAALGLGFGLLLGVVAGLVSRRTALLGLVTVLVASALGAVVAAQVGFALSPPDPQVHAIKANICTEAPCKEYSAGLVISGWTPYLVWSIGALASYFVVMLSGPTPPDRQQEAAADPGAWLAVNARSETSPPQ